MPSYCLRLCRETQGVTAHVACSTLALACFCISIATRACAEYVQPVQYVYLFKEHDDNPGL